MAEQAMRGDEKLLRAFRKRRRNSGTAAHWDSRTEVFREVANHDCLLIREQLRAAQDHLVDPSLPGFRAITELRHEVDGVTLTADLSDEVVSVTRW
jgi:hypothetical protein